MTVQGFRFAKRKKQRLDIPLESIRTRAQVEDEGLTGYVHGQPAGSEDEERFARAFDKLGIKFQYQVPIQTDYSMPDEDKMVDFVLEDRQPVEPRGFISHYYSIDEEAHDLIRENQLNEIFRQIGWNPLISIKYTEYEGGQAAVDEYVRRNLAGI